MFQSDTVAFHHQTKYNLFTIMSLLLVPTYFPVFPNCFPVISLLKLSLLITCNYSLIIHLSFPIISLLYISIIAHYFLLISTLFPSYFHIISDFSHIFDNSNYSSLNFLLFPLFPTISFLFLPYCHLISTSFPMFRFF